MTFSYYVSLSQCYDHFCGVKELKKNTTHLKTVWRIRIIFIRIRIQAQKDTKTGKSLKFDLKKAHIPSFVCLINSSVAEPVGAEVFWLEPEPL